MTLPPTEHENPKTKGIDRVSTIEAVKLINEEDHFVAKAIESIVSEIAEAVDRISEQLKKGGRLFYVGAGTSGRLGVLDASEIPPTFGVSKDLMVGVIAGGYKALHEAVEGSEDDENKGQSDLRELGLSKIDSVIGIAASGTTPYTIGAVKYAKSLGCFTSCITCSPGSPITEIVDCPLVAEVGPEAIAGSTRMKSGSAQKMILNMISTVAMIRLGYVKGNKMTNLTPGNAKLVDRALRILAEETGLNPNDAAALFEAADRDLKTALVMHKSDASLQDAEEALRKTSGNVEAAITKINTTL